MSNIEHILDRTDELIRKGRQEEPHRLLRDLIETAGTDELDVWKHDLSRLIEKFMPKRRGDLSRLLSERSSSSSTPTTSPNLPIHIQAPKRDDRAAASSVVETSLDNLQRTLEDLASAHIFQWSTYYRDAISDHISLFLQTQPASGQYERARDLLQAHAKYIFMAGYEYQGVAGGLSHKIRVEKALAGLERFLELPIESYTSLISTASVSASQTLRCVTSAFLAGILRGYSDSHFGSERGSANLPRFPRSWANCLGFLTSADAASVADSLEQGDFAYGLLHFLVPTILGIEGMIRQTEDYFPGPLLCEFNWNRRRLDIMIQEPPDASEPRRIQLICVLNDSFLAAADLEEADRVGVAILTSNIRADLDKFIRGKADRALRVVGINPEDPSGSSRRIEVQLDEVIYARRSHRGLQAPLTYNFAREFPLRNPRSRKFYHVARISVRDLMKTFERRNGIRLWCSVRRSGKTTACFELTSSEMQSVVVSQTCDSTDPHAHANVLFDGIVDALEDGNQIRRDFVTTLVRSCAPRDAERFVLVLDEYETLFHRLRVALNRDPDVRYTVVQPFLNQLVAFSQDNLLVFLGQQPNMHYMLMDQNQLSAYVQQDPFPLFQHIAGTTVGEFSELIRKVFGSRITFDPGFADAVFEEVAGHPYLTVNLLVEFVEWLIDSARPRKNLRVHRDDVSQFEGERLTRRRIKLSTEYDFFREAVGEAISENGRKGNPWLYAAYTLIKRLSKEGFAEWTSLQRAGEIVEKMKIPVELDIEYLVRSLVSSNFLEMEGDSVRPRIKLLARICEATLPKARVPQ